jgi:hypothetical protein
MIELLIFRVSDTLKLPAHFSNATYFENLVPISHKATDVFITKNKRLALFTKIISAYLKNHETREHFVRKTIF